MGTFQDRQKQYTEVDEPTALKKHIAGGIRKKFASDFDMSDLSDQEVIQKHYARFGESMEPTAYGEKLLKVYGGDYTPPSAPKETLGEHVQDAGNTVKNFATNLVPYLVPEAPKAVAAVAPKAALGVAAKAIATKIPVASQIGFVGGHAINEAVDSATAQNLEKTAASLPVPDVDAQTQDFYAKLQPGLAARGIPDDQIMQEARRRAQNIKTGYQQTTESIDQDVAQTQQQAAISEPAHAAADAFFVGVGAPAIEGALQKGLTKLGLMGAQAVAKPAAATLVGTLASHIKTGVVVGAPGVGIQGAVEAGLQTAAENKSPQEIGQALVQGGLKGVKEGAIGGAIIGAAGGALEQGVGAVVKPFVKAAQRKAFLEDAAVREVDEARLRGWQKFNADQRQNLVKTEAQVKASIKVTGDSFNPHTYKGDLSGNPAEIATTIVQQKHGEDAVLTEEGLRAASRIADQIGAYQAADQVLNPTTALPSGNMVPTQPIGGQMFPEPGGTAPEPHQVGEVPIAEPRRDFLPPSGIPPMEGLEGAPTPRTAPPAQPSTEPLQVEGVAPQEPAPRSGVELRSPLHIERTGRPEPVSEPHPRLGPESPAPQEVQAPSKEAVKEEILAAPAPKTRETNPLAQHVVETYKQENKFTDKEGRDMFPQVDKARAERIAHEYQDLQNAKPGTPEFEDARKSYDTLNKEVKAQYQAIKKAGYKIEFVEKDPYKNSAEMRADVRDNKTLKVLKTPPGHHPFMTPAQNDIFRAVHDFFGHAAEGYEFGPRGEEAAFQQHAATLSNGSIPALASETRGQNSWVNFHPDNASKPIAERPFAEQKFGLMPEHTYEDVLHPKATPTEGTPAAEAHAQEAAPAVKPQVSTPEAAPTEPESAPSLATGEVHPQLAEALAKLKDETHADIKPTDDGQGLHIQLGVKPGEVAKAGGQTTALDRVVASADAHGLRVETDLVPAPAPKGGKIPLEKLIPWYEQRGFKVTESTRIPEGNLGTAKLVREPLGTHQNDVAAALEKAAADARARIAKKSGRLSSGFDPSLIGDYAIELAADAFSKRLRNGDEMASWAVQKWGEAVKPFLDKLTTLAQKHFTRMFKETGNAEKSLDDLLTLKESGKYGMGWYEKTADWAKGHFGQDNDMFLRFLAVTSANGQTESGAAMALKAFSQWKMGMPFEGFRSTSMVGQLNNVVENKNLGENTKIQQFLEALRGNPDAIVLDRWMIDALNMREKGGSLRPKDYEIYANVVKQLARDNEMTPRQFQAAVWEGARVRSIHTKEAAGGRSLSTKTGSARPLEELVERKLGGMTPEEYGQATEGHLKMMQNLYQGLAPVRTGIIKDKGGNWEGLENAPEGHTFDPETFAPAAHKGHVVSLVSNVTDRNRLYPARILKFREQIAPLIAELKAKGLKPTIGIWRMGSDKGPDGTFSIDLNVMVGDESKALTLGKSARQITVARLGAGGAWEQNLNTGYDPAVNGKQYLPPKDWKKQNAWHKQASNRARTFVNKSLGDEGVVTGAETKSTLSPPARKYEQVTKVVKGLVDTNRGNKIPDLSLRMDGGIPEAGRAVWLLPDGTWGIHQGPYTHAESGMYLDQAMKESGLKADVDKGSGLIRILDDKKTKYWSGNSLYVEVPEHGYTPTEEQRVQIAKAMKEKKYDKIVWDLGIDPEGEKHISGEGSLGDFLRAVSPRNKGD